ncbi:MAG: hypothetical protein ACP5I4_12650 [Oceanipulchritudo sp.]|jgi:hypothetical protein
MKDSKQARWTLSARLLVAVGLLLFPPSLGAQSGTVELEKKVAQLERELAEARNQLQAARTQATEAEERAGEAETKLAQAADTGPSKIELAGPFGGTWKIGGAIRANYYVGDYADPNGDTKGTRSDSGTISLDTFRINVDYENGPIVGKFEYRFYAGYRASGTDSYSFPHTAWLGYNFEGGDQVQVGINRVPFGPGAYGISQSWFFDQHFYVGLADDMDFGVKYITQLGDVKVDLGYYYTDEGNWVGENFSEDSVRYSYDVTNESKMGYKERNQLNARVRMPVELGEDVTSEVGASLQYGQLDSEGEHDDGDHWAASLHAVTSVGNWRIATQLTRYKYDLDEDQPLGTDKLVQFGAYDFPTLVAADAWIPAVSVSYYHETPRLPWLDYVIPYVEYSSIIKKADGFNDSELVTIGAAWGRGGWYIYTEFAYSNGNDFVGDGSQISSDGSVDWTQRFGANPNDDWQYRFNLNFGYYF